MTHENRSRTLTAHRVPTEADLKRATPTATGEYELKFRDWLRARYLAFDHGCLTGDCLHEDEDDCLVALRVDFQESMQ